MTLTFGFDLGQGHDTPLDHEQQLAEICRNGFWLCVLWHWPWRYDIRSMLWHSLGSRTTTGWNVKIQLVSKELWSRQRFWLCVHFDLRDMTMCQAHKAPLGHWQQLSDISRSNMAVMEADSWHLIPMKMCLFLIIDLGGSAKRSREDFWYIIRMGIKIRSPQKLFVLQLVWFKMYYDWTITSYSWSMDLGYVCIVALTFEMWH